MFITAPTASQLHSSVPPCPRFPRETRWLKYQDSQSEILRILITVYTDFFTTLFHIYNPRPAPSRNAVTETQADVRVSDCNQLAEGKKQSQEKPA